MIRALRHRRRTMLKRGVRLLNQQIWCWGRDILRPEGNWLIELGFERVRAPKKRDGCPSVYFLQLPGERSVVLRGFGMLYADPARGIVFLPRYEFEPRYTPNAELERMPWTVTDLPELATPSGSQRACCGSLTSDAIDWMRRYEADVIDRLGLAYRRSTLIGWKDKQRRVMPAERMVPAWRSLGVALADRFQ